MEPFSSVNANVGASSVSLAYYTSKPQPYVAICALMCSE